jgi:hypothetical protein
MNLPYLAYASGILPTAPGGLQTSNIEMWPLDQIYRLRSDLISLSLAVDADDEAIQRFIDAGFESILTSLHNAEDLEPLKLDHLKVRPVGERDSAVTTFGAACPPFGHARPRAEGLARTRIANRPRAQSLRSLTPESLWENADLFLKPIEKLSAVQRFLHLSQPHDRRVLEEAPGPHYSTTLPKDPAVVSDQFKSRLVIPPPPPDLTGTTDSASSLHARLVSAVVPLLGTEETVPIPDDGAPPASQILRDLRRAEELATPVGEDCSFGAFARLNFEERLGLELQAAGITGAGKVVHTVDCPILQDLADALEREGAVIAEANRWRKIVSEFVEKGKAVIEERAKQQRQWTVVLNNHLAQERAKIMLEKKKARAMHGTGEPECD